MYVPLAGLSLHLCMRAQLRHWFLHASAKGYWFDTGVEVTTL
jgi:hypothetical protein